MVREQREEKTPGVEKTARLSVKVVLRKSVLQKIREIPLLSAWLRWMRELAMRLVVPLMI